jgi:hypothetical protein
MRIATSSWGARRNLPFAFTEHGVAMLSDVLASQRAVKISVLIIRAFVQHKQTSLITILADEVSELKRIPPPGPKRRIGFPRQG